MQENRDSGMGGSSENYLLMKQTLHSGALPKRIFANGQEDLHTKVLPTLCNSYITSML